MLPPPMSSSFTRFRDCHGRRLPECAGNQWLWRTSGLDPSSTCAYQTNARQDHHSPETSAHWTPGCVTLGCFRALEDTALVFVPGGVTRTRGSSAAGVDGGGIASPSESSAGVSGSECHPPDGPKGPSASKFVERSRSSAAASGSAPCDKPSAPALSKFVGRLRGWATGARPCPKRAVGKTLRPSKQLLCRCQGTGRGGPVELPKEITMARSRFQRLEATVADPPPVAVPSPFIDLTG